MTGGWSSLPGKKIVDQSENEYPSLEKLHPLVKNSDRPLIEREGVSWQIQLYINLLLQGTLLSDFAIEKDAASPQF